MNENDRVEVGARVYSYNPHTKRKRKMYIVGIEQQTESGLVKVALSKIKGGGKSSVDFVRNSDVIEAE